MRNYPHLCKEISKARERLSRILDKDLWNLLRVHGYFAGGCFASLALNQPVKDYDIFITNRRVARRVRAELINLAHQPTDAIEVLSITEQAVSFTERGAPTYPYFQVITKYVGEPHSVLSEFDYVHCQAYSTLYSEYNVLRMLNDSEWWDVLDKQRLRVPANFKGVLSQKRIDRLAARGWVVETEEMRGLDLLARTDIGDES